MAAVTSLTIDDFERLLAEAAENHELVDGELIDVSGNTPRHNLLRDRLSALLLRWAADRGAGTVIAEQEFDFLGNAHGPDISFFRTDKQKLVDLDRRVQRFVLDLAIEIASESDTYEGLRRKKARYTAAPVPVKCGSCRFKTARLRCMRKGQDRILHAEDVLSTELLPGFRVAVEELFRGL